MRGRGTRLFQRGNGGLVFKKRFQRGEELSGFLVGDYGRKHGEPALDNNIKRN